VSSLFGGCPASSPSSQKPMCTASSAAAPAGGERLAEHGPVRQQPGGQHGGQFPGPVHQSLPQQRVGHAARIGTREFPGDGVEPVVVLQYVGEVERTIGQQGLDEFDEGMCQYVVARVARREAGDGAQQVVVGAVGGQEQGGQVGGQQAVQRHPEVCGQPAQRGVPCRPVARDHHPGEADRDRRQVRGRRQPP